MRRPTAAPGCYYDGCRLRTYASSGFFYVASHILNDDVLRHDRCRCRCWRSPVWLTVWSLCCHAATKHVVHPHVPLFTKQYMTWYRPRPATLWSIDVKTLEKKNLKKTLTTWKTEKNVLKRGKTSIICQCKITCFLHTCAASLLPVPPVLWFYHVALPVGLNNVANDAKYR